MRLVLLVGKEIFTATSHKDWELKNNNWMKYAHIEKALVMDLKRANPNKRPDTPVDYFNTDLSITQMSVVFSTLASCDTFPPCSSSPLWAAATFSASAAESGVTNPSAGGPVFGSPQILCSQFLWVTSLFSSLSAQPRVASSLTVISSLFFTRLIPHQLPAAQ